MKVYNILYKYLFENIKNKTIREEILESLKEEERLPLSLRLNMEVRERVYALLERYRLLTPHIPLSEFLILDETQYFQYLISPNNPTHMLFIDIKNIYEDAIKDLGFSEEFFAGSEEDLDSKGFFEECFEKSMKDVLVELEQLRFFLNEFASLGKDFHFKNQELLNIILDGIKRKLRICGDSEEILEIVKILFKIDLLGQNAEECSVFLETAFFNAFFSNFHLDYSFAQLDQEQASAEEDNTIIFEAIQKYCRGDFERSEFNFLELLINPYDKEELVEKKVNIRRPIEFFQFMLFITNQIGFERKPKLNMVMLEYFLICMLEQERFEEINDLNVELFNFVKNKDPREFFEELIIKHVKQIETNSNDIDSIYDRVVNSLTLVSPITIRIKQERAYLDLCKHITDLNDNIMTKIGSIRN